MKSLTTDSNKTSTHDEWAPQPQADPTCARSDSSTAIWVSHCTHAHCRHESSLSRRAFHINCNPPNPPTARLFSLKLVGMSTYRVFKSSQVQHPRGLGFNSPYRSNNTTSRTYLLYPSPSQWKFRYLFFACRRCVEKCQGELSSSVWFRDLTVF